MRYVTLDSKIEAPVVVDAGLPAIFRLVEFLGVQRRMQEVPREEVALLDESL